MTGAPTDDQLSLTQSQIQDLAEGHGDATTIEILRNGQYSKFLEALASIQELAPDETQAAFALLEQAQQRDSDAYARALQYPFVLSWGWGTFDVLMGMHSQEQRSIHVGHLDGIAASTAYQCNVDFEIDVAVQDKSLSLPGLGIALFPEANNREMARVVCRDRVLTITCSEQTIVVPQNLHTQSDHWHGVRPVVAHGGELELSIVIDDVDPYRIYHPMTHRFPPAGRLDEVSFKNWQESVSNAWMLIVGHHEKYAEALATGLRVLVPLATDQTVGDRAVNAFGSIVVADTDYRWVAFVMLVEFQKSKFTAYDYLCPLHHAAIDEGSYLVPWRPQVPVSFRHYFETLYAMRLIIEFWIEQSKTVVDEEERIYMQMRLINWHSRVDQGRDVVLGSGKLSRLGHAFVDHIARFENLPSLTFIDDEVVRYARAVELDTKLTSRLQVLSPDEETVAQLATAWMTPKKYSPKITMKQSLFVERPTLPGWLSRRWLGKRKLADREWFMEIMNNESYLHMLDENADLLDVWLMADRFEDVAMESCERIARDGDDLESWLRLALSCRELRDFSSFTLTNFPEVAHAVYMAILAKGGPAPNPLDLARWLAPALLTSHKSSFECLMPKRQMAD